jgi:hypothetical protein
MQALHDVGNGQHLGALGLVCFEGGDFLGESATVSEALRRLHERCPNRFRSAQAGCLEGPERPERFVVQANGDGM